MDTKPPIAKKVMIKEQASSEAVPTNIALVVSKAETTSPIREIDQRSPKKKDLNILDSSKEMWSFGVGKLLQLNVPLFPLG